ncbi:hypothetical protein HpMS107_60850 [Helicobacter pylori]|uniref:hypothetical protein n=1 Tax=Cupriavidus TaxID=106589 RepID=UPI000B03F264|nr:MULTISPECIES: hypothetical protein [Cupriavidus]
MIARLILASIRNRFLVLLATVMVTAWGLWAVLSLPPQNESLAEVKLKQGEM